MKNFIISINTKLIGLFLLSFVGTVFLVKPIFTKATAPSTAFTGKCAFVTNPRSSADRPLLNSGENTTISSSGFLDFDNLRINYADTKWTLCINCADTYEQVIHDTNITLVDDPEITGAKEMAFTLNGQTAKVRLIAATSGNTIIFQGKNVTAIGICNKI